MSRILYPDYDNCLVNLSNSLLKYYGVDNNFPGLAILDKYLNKDYKNVVLILYDGLGSKIIDRHLNDDSFLKKHKVCDITSVFPATTTAATGSVLSAMYPSQHCWLGWDNYIKPLDQVVTMFRNVAKGSSTPIASYDVSKDNFPYTTIIKKIAENTATYWLSPFDGYYYNPSDFNSLFNKITDLCATKEKKFIYVYCIEPDALMHEYGCEDKIIKDMVVWLDQKTAELSEQIQNSLLIVIADHGLIDIKKYIVLSDYPDLKAMLMKETSIEARAVNFFVKENKITAFKKEFNRLFAEDFILLSKAEVLKKQLFGKGQASPKFTDCLGDYLAIAISDKAILDSYDYYQAKALHAGLCEEEVLVPLIISSGEKRWN